MKSAYELAMERLNEEAPQKQLTEEQKEAIARIDELYRSKIAEKEVFLGDLIAKATAVGSLGEVAELEEQKNREISRFRSKAEEEKEKIRSAG